MEPVPVRALLLALATLVTGGWATDGLKGDELFARWLPEGTPQGWVAAGATTLFVLCAWRLFLHRRELMGVGALSQHPAEARRALVLPLSVPRPLPVIGPGAGARVGAVNLTGNLRRDVELLSEAGLRWNWQQVLRALKPHADTLEHVYLIGSADDAAGEGSHRCMEHAKTLVRLYFPEGGRLRGVHHPGEPVDFDDVRAMMAAMRRGIDVLTDDTGLRQEDVVIDVTGGLKPTSIAGAVMTLNGAVTFQYVHTNKADEVWEYDLLHKGTSEV